LERPLYFLKEVKPHSLEESLLLTKSTSILVSPDKLNQDPEVAVYATLDSLSANPPKNINDSCAWHLQRSLS